MHRNPPKVQLGGKKIYNRTVKERWAEIVIVVVIAAISVVALRSTEHQVSYREPIWWSLQLPLQKAEDSPKSIPGAPRMLLKPNLQRDPALFNASDISVDGVRLGMSFHEVWDVLGEPKEIWGNPPGDMVVAYAGRRGQGTRLRFAEDKVVDVEGTQLCRGLMELAQARDPISGISDKLGPNDYRHLLGYGGSPLYCWASPVAVLEVTSGETGLYAFHLSDPSYHKDRPHLWFSSCGAVEDELYEGGSES